MYNMQPILTSFHVDFKFLCIPTIYDSHMYFSPLTSVSFHEAYLGADYLLGFKVSLWLSFLLFPHSADHSLAVEL